MNDTLTSPAARDLGIPVKSVNWVQLFPGRNARNQPLLLATMGQDAGGFFVCDIDLVTGHCTQYSSGMKNANFPTAAYQNPRTGVLYVGSAYAGHLHRFDPNTPRDQRRLEDPAAPEGSNLKDLGQCSQSIGDAYSMGNLTGKMYIALYPGGRLTVYDPSRPYHFGEGAEANPINLLCSPAVVSPGPRPAGPPATRRRAMAH